MFIFQLFLFPSFSLKKERKEKIKITHQNELHKKSHNSNSSTRANNSDSVLTILLPSTSNSDHTLCPHCKGREAELYCKSIANGMQEIPLLFYYIGINSKNLPTT